MKLVLLPGLDGTGQLFDPFIDALPSDVESMVIAYPSKQKLNYQQLCEYVLARLPINEEFILVGESFSGPIAYSIALRKPDNMKAVVFVATFLRSPRRLLLALSSLLPRSLLLSLPAPGFIIKAYVYGANTSAKLIRLFRKTMRTVSAAVVSYRLSQIAGLSPPHARCDLRALYIQASDDKLVPQNCVDDFKALMENLSVVRVNGPHFLLQATPSLCAEIIVNEMRSLSSQA